MGLDITEYRMWENLAHKQLDSYRIRQKHNLDVFEKYGFPVHLDSREGVHPLINSLQEKRFDPFMKDLNGLSPSELDLFVSVCARMVMFQFTYLPNQKPVIPFDVMISSFSIFRKLKALKPDFKTIMEIGPGCGYLSFFLNGHEALANYTQIEACESFFMLQNMINQHVFGHEFITRVEPAAPQGYESYESYYPALPDPLKSYEIDRPYTVDIERPVRCTQYPWWNIAQVQNNDLTYDVVTSNANLMEFSTEALYDYLSLIKAKLSDNGIFFAQCFGYGGGVGRTIETLWDALYHFKFAPLFITSNVYMETQKILAEIPGGYDNVVLFPAGMTARQIVADPEFRDRFDTISLVDKAAKTSTTPGVEMLTPDQVVNDGKTFALIVHKAPEIVQSYSALCEKLGIPFKTLAELNCEKQFAVPYGVFVGENHPAFEQHYDRQNFERSGSAGVLEDMSKVFLPDGSDKIIYSKDDIHERVLKSVKAML